LTDSIILITDAKATFESLSSIQIYSLQPSILPDLNVLVDVVREIGTTYGHEDPLESGKQWGMIQNPYVKVNDSPASWRASAKRFSPSAEKGYTATSASRPYDRNHETRRCCEDDPKR
jgi:hypothetical protein